MSLKRANKMKQLKDFESEELFLQYLASEIEDYISKNEINDNSIDTFVEFFIAHSYNAPYIKIGRLVLYRFSYIYFNFL